MKILIIQDLRKKPGFDSKSLFFTHKYLQETGFAEFAFVSPVIVSRGVGDRYPSASPIFVDFVNFYVNI
ncbi:MAG: hypothetical protein O4753_15705 [Trichodesmium sp. St7_bin2_1]|nr:hypothetical protein [Trichodesmium sp. St7_bin2_1]